PLDQLVFTMNEPKAGAEIDDVLNTETQLNGLLAPYNRAVTRPSDAEFASSVPQSHRKGETAYHVKAHRGSKEGYLFFLPHGVVFGFKKPLVFFPFGVIESVSYTSVLQRTFNLVVAATEPGAVGAAGTGEVKETEFSMLDQADFAGIDAYIKKHGLNDASMAAQRRAKAYNVNKDNKKVLTSTDANGGGLALVEGEEEDEGGVEDDAARQKTEQELQDEEDELEEDYEASGGESDGEGEDSGEDDGEEGEGYENGYDEDNE
ncbi:Rtt106-domain-containing protein, partial [Dissoconium aciculare CBS 342.82]|uniref:Rtt106-domain-containing protein n=1 Tax=Dissoconium aciculare CBS 342.82 TaxID=1314786 RepID=A0A6J3LZU8_9PEZI